MLFRGYIAFWNDYSFVDKCDFFNTTTQVYMNKYGFTDGVTKKSVLSSVLEEVINCRDESVTNEMYFTILNYTENVRLEEKFISILWKLLELDGVPIDNYFIYMKLSAVYSINLKDNDKGIDVCLKSYQEIDSYFPYFKDMYEKLDKSFSGDNYLPSYVFSRDCLIYTLIDACKFEEAEKYEGEMIKRGLFSGSVGEDRLYQNQYMRLKSHIPFLLNNNQLELAILKVNELRLINEKSASIHYKMVASYLHKIKDFEQSLKFYQLSLDLNPTIEGVENRIISLNKKLKK
jgi:tetratricopeptide (TPR) repeat protein